MFIRGSMSINICYDDIFKIGFEDIRDKIVVIPVNTAFDTIVDESIVNVSKTLVSPNTIHGKFIKALMKYGMSKDEIDRRIMSFFDIKNIHPVMIYPLKYRPRGKRAIYEFGSVSVIEYMHTTFFLLALSEFNDNNNAQCNQDQFICAVQRLIYFCDRYSQGKNIYIPLLGTNLSRVNMAHKESLQSMVSLFKLYSRNLHNKINIVIYTGDKNKVSIYDAQ